MNKEETLALYAQGKDVWNKWANEMLAEKKRLEENGEWEASKVAWENVARAQFSSPVEKHEFSGFTDFNGFVFPGDAWFEGANFSSTAAFRGVSFYGEARFLGTKFSGDVWFRDAIFSGAALFEQVFFYGEARFRGANFSGKAWFYDAIFSSRAGFKDATFRKQAQFRRITFNKLADFSHARFEHQAAFSGQFHEEAVFYAIDSKGGFTLTGTQFARVPNFIQAHFVEAPMLDGVVIPEDTPRSPSFQRKLESHPEKSLDSRLRGNDGEGRGNDGEGSKRGESSKKISPSPHPSPLKGEGETAYYRTLKRMAIQAHDHRNEQNFFAAELKSMRGTEHQPYGKNCGWYWAGVFYEILSDFGRSPRRVLEWMCIQFVAFLYAYLFMGGTQAACVAGEGNRFWSTAQLSLGKTLFPFGNVMDSTSHLTACLYGITKEFGQNDRFVPVIPDWFPFLSLTQSLCALLLIFLLLLAIRAHFRVK